MEQEGLTVADIVKGLRGKYRVSFIVKQGKPEDFVALETATVELQKPLDELDPFRHFVFEVASEIQEPNNEVEIAVELWFSTDGTNWWRKLPLLIQGLPEGAVIMSLFGAVYQLDKYLHGDADFEIPSDVMQMLEEVMFNVHDTLVIYMSTRCPVCIQQIPTVVLYSYLTGLNILEGNNVIIKFIDTSKKALVEAGELKLSSVPTFVINGMKVSGGPRGLQNIAEFVLGRDPDAKPLDWVEEYQEPASEPIAETTEETPPEVTTQESEPPMEENSSEEGQA